MKNEDLELFRQEMGDVQPLQNTGRAPTKRDGGPTPGQRYRRNAAESKPHDGNFLSTELVDPVHALDILSFKRDGVQNGVFRRLKQGRYSIDATLDLHRLSVEQASCEVYKFVRECVKYDVRTALISHGKGMRSENRPALIKSFVAKWLPMLPEVMAFHSAQNFHGGVGSVYVLLRKTKKQKEVNRRRFGLSK